MKKTTLWSLAIASSTLLLFTACGGGSNTKQSPSSETEIKTVEQAKTSFQALSAMNSLNEFSEASTTTTQVQKNNIHKPTTHACESGSITVEETETFFSLTANKCKFENYYMNGTMEEKELSNGSLQFTMSNLTMQDGEIEMRSTQMIFIEDTTEGWSTMDGDINIISKCFTGNFNFKTVEKIYDAQDGSENAESGIVELNGVRYTFNNPYVTIKTATEEETILQRELEKRMNNTTTCTE